MRKFIEFRKDKVSETENSYKLIIRIPFVKLYEYKLDHKTFEGAFKHTRLYLILTLRTPSAIRKEYQLYKQFITIAED